LIGVPFVEATDAARYGGKSASLGRAIAAGLPVPDGCGLDPASVEEVVADTGNARKEIHALFDSLGPAVAVRSSAIGEDSTNASFAGQHQTLLNVRSPEAVIEAIGEVHASARTEAALAYRRKLGLEGEPHPEPGRRH